MFSHCAFAFAKRIKMAGLLKTESRIDTGSFLSGTVKNVREGVQEIVHERLCLFQRGKFTRAYVGFVMESARILFLLFAII